MNQDEILSCLVHGIKPGDSYPESVREFCLSIHYYSPAAYKTLRKKFNKNIPHPQTIASWYRYSNIKGDPGIHTETLERLKTVAAKVMGEIGKPLV